MKVKAVIFRPDRTNDVVILKKKQLDGKVFKHGGSVYFIDPNNQQITWTRPFRFYKKYYSTYYYFYKVANPIPLADMNAMIIGKKTVVNTEEGPNKGQYAETADWKTITNLGVSEEEMAAIFTPWFYRTIAPTTVSWWEQISFLLQAGTAIGVVYVIYLLSKMQG